MVSQALIQSKVNFGYAKAATVLGAPNPWYRPFDASAPIAPRNLLGNVTVLYDTNANMKQAVASKREKPEDWYGAFDNTGLQIGDYLVDPTLGPFFIASMELFRAAKMVRCNTTVSTQRPNPNPPGDAFYGGYLSSESTATLTGWACALIQGTKGEKSVTNLPGDVRAPWIEVLLPASAPVVLFGDELTDAAGRGYVISNVEITALGQRITASYSGT